ncbi:hypothetical protein PMAYCL1PPCAC_03602, partial [Pristionchus mayeri]
TWGWDKIVIFICPDCYNSPLARAQMRINYIIEYLTKNGITILTQRTFRKNDTAEMIVPQLNDTRARGRIYVPLGGPDLSTYSEFLRAAKMSNLDPIDFAVVLVSNIYNVNGFPMPWKAAPDLVEYFKMAVIIYNDCYNASDARNFASQIGISTDKTDELAMYMSLYESVFFYSNLIEAQKMANDSRGLLNFVRFQLFSGPFGNYTLNEVTNRLTPFRVIRINETSGDPVDVATVSIQNVQCTQDSSKQCLGLKATIIDHGINSSLDLPMDMPVCGFEGELCEQTQTVLILLGVVALFALASVGFCVYRRLSGGTMREMPWLIPSASINFINYNEGERGKTTEHSFQNLLQELSPNPNGTSNGTSTGTSKDGTARAERSRNRQIPLPPK